MNATDTLHTRDDGPLGRMLTMTGRHPYRAPGLASHLRIQQFKKRARTQFNQIQRLAGTQFPLFDAVVVPSARGPENILRASATARRAGTRLVVLASRKTEATATAELLRVQGWTKDSAMVADIGDEIPSVFMALKTATHPMCTTSSDIPLKRNIALLLARTMNWRSILFIDDDIQALDRSQLRRTAGLLRGIDRGGCPRKAAGWAFNDFPDFSVAGHAFRFGRDVETAFIGGGALAVDCGPETPFFPFLYNEDLLFLLTHLTHDPNSVGLVGTLNQDAYDPFSDTSRAAAQEFGDVLAYGLFHLLSEEMPTEIAEYPDYWSAILTYRNVLLDYSTTRLHRLRVAGGAACAKAASAQHRDDWPSLLADYFLMWKADLPAWRTITNSVPSTTDLVEATAWLRLSVHHPRW